MNALYNFSSEVQSKRSTLTRATLTRATLTRATLTRATLTRATLTRATLTQATLTQATLVRQMIGKNFCFLLAVTILFVPNVGKAQEERGPAGQQIVLKDSLTADEAKMFDALQNGPAIDFPKNMSIRELAMDLTERGVPTFVDLRAFEEEGADPDGTVNFPNGAKTLGAQVFFGLDNQDLTLDLKHGMWRITTKTDAEDKQHRLTIDISPMDMEPIDLTNAIQSTVEPLSWEENGGPAGATLSIVPVNGKVLLVVRNTTELTLAVRAFVNNLATLAGTTADSPTSPKMLRYENPKPVLATGHGHSGVGGYGDAGGETQNAQRVPQGGRGGGLFDVK